MRVPSNQYLPVPKPNDEVPVIVTTPRPAQPTTTRYVPAQTTTRYVPAQTTTRYVPAQTTTRYVPQQTTTRYVPQPTTTRYVPQQTTTRYVPAQTTFKAEEYIPPIDNEVPQPSNDDQTIIRPTVSTSRPTQPRPTQPRPTQPRPIQPRPTPGVQVQDENIIIPVGCSAAMNCTPIEYCTATGTISKTPVILTPEQELFRVPMTDCRDANTGARGKCCRDLDYVDPWPASMLGQYNAEVLGFDDGSYKPERRRRNQGQFQNGAASNKVNRQVAAPVQREQFGSASQAISVRQPLNQPRLEPARRAVQEPIQQVANQQQSCGLRNLVSEIISCI